MMKAAITVGGPVGLHARPAAAFVREAEKYRSEVRLTKDGMRVNAKSILALLTLAAETGSSVVLEVWGEDEAQAFEALRSRLEHCEV
jgi:phosphotransferase system HPr (HPr) family protein